METYVIRVSASNEVSAFTLFDKEMSLMLGKIVNVFFGEVVLSSEVFMYLAKEECDVPLESYLVVDSDKYDTGIELLEARAEVLPDSSGYIEVMVVNNPSVVVMTTTPDTILSEPNRVKVNEVVYREQAGHESETGSDSVIDDDDTTRKVAFDRLFRVVLDREKIILEKLKLDSKLALVMVDVDSELGSEELVSGL